MEEAPLGSELCSPPGGPSLARPQAALGAQGPFGHKRTVTCQDAFSPDSDRKAPFLFLPHIQTKLFYTHSL